MRRAFVFGLGVLLSLGGAALMIGCSPSSQARADGAEDTAFVKVVNVEVMPVSAGDFVDRVRIAGEVQAMNDVTVSAEESGVIGRFVKEKGAFVRKGELIARIDDRVLQAQLEEAAAEAKLAAERFERQRRLWEEERIGSEMTYLEARYQSDLAQARLQSLQARLARTRIVAPIAGIFDIRFVDAGEMVTAGTAVARVVEVARLKVTGGVPERFAGSVAVGDTARVTFDLLAEQSTPATISYVGTTIEPQSRTFPVELMLENPDRTLKPNMLANVEIPTQRLRDVMVIPQDAVLRTEVGYQVFVVEEPEGVAIARARAVRLGPGSGGRVVVREGLEAGERLIVRGQNMVDAGDRVRIVGHAEAN